MTNLSHLISNLSSKPGIYQYFDKDGKIIYVGKAKNIKKRVQSYFNKEQEHPKTRILVRKIVSIETIVVETEYDALILENTLIKKYQPKYNIMLKDDKTYPWICIKNENFSRVFKTRKVIKDGSEYFGPYPNIKLIYSLLAVIKELFPIRNCYLDLSEQKVNEKKYKVCLEFHIKNCLGPCIKNQSIENHNENIKSIRHILKGNFKEILDTYKLKMFENSGKLEFEKAQEFKEKIEVLLSYQQKSTVVNVEITNVDVFYIISDPDFAYVNYLKIINGAINQGHTLEIKKNMDETDEEILKLAVVDIRTTFNSTCKEIYVPFEMDLIIPGVKINVPKIGDKKRIIDLSKKNALEYRLQKLNSIKQVDPEKHTNRIMNEMKMHLKMNEEPRYIEGFDNSNMQGTNAVSACVVFKDGKPSKKDYRIFNTKTVEGPNDFATMEEVVYRRYKRLLEENQPLPQLIIIDGGKGQLSSAMKSLKQLGLYPKIKMIGIAKRLEELFFPNDSIPLYLDKQSETLKVIQHIRNESHRFGISKHRDKRSKNAFTSELDSIKGIGEQTKEKLLSTYKSLVTIKSKTEEELISLIGKRKTTILLKSLNNLS